MPGGRPTEYSPDMVKKAWEYMDNYNTKHGHEIPSLVGLCKVLNRGKTTLYNWADDTDKEFRDIIDTINEIQQLALLNGGLNGSFNSTITKLILGRHGYTDKQELEVTGTLREATDEELEEEALRLLEEAKDK